VTVHGSKKTRAPSPGIPQYGLFLILAADIYDTEGITIRGLKTARLLECANPAKRPIFLLLSASISVYLRFHSSGRRP
jgi:hypothetical protein